ncbi:MAG: carbohydrate kinase family protein [Anaerolineaceae bacterium]|nr:carbohydrate kinase family protein [Anaerolineaceae bacterium]
MNKKVICAGHICIDITPVFDEKRHFNTIGELLEPGKLISMHGVSVNTGGSVANTGLAMKLLGNDVRLMGKVGDDAFGNMIRDIAASYGADGLLVEKGAVTSYSVVLAIPGMDRIFLHDPGANDSFSDMDIPWDEIEGTALFHFGYPPLMKRMYADNGDTLSSLFRRMKEMDIATSLDLAAIDPQSAAGRADWEMILSKSLPFTDLFVPSFEELCWILDRDSWLALSSRGGDMTEEPELMKYAEPLADRCIRMGCGAVLIKCGVSGMYFKTSSGERISRIGSRIGLNLSDWADRSGIQPCFEAEIVRSATGSGDVSIAAFLTAVLAGETPERCAVLAAAEGAASVTVYDALSGILPLEELSRRIQSGWKTKEI